MKTATGILIIAICVVGLVSFTCGYLAGNENIKYATTGSTNNAELITYINMQTPPIYTPVAEQKIFILGENPNDKNQYMVYALENNMFAYVDKSQIVLDTVDTP